MANMSCARVRGLVVRHSLFVVADCCCCRRFHATQYDMMISCARVQYFVVAVVRRDVSLCACARGLVVRLSLFVIAVVAVAVARRNTKMPCACARGVIVDIHRRHCRSCCRCRRCATRRVVVRLRTRPGRRHRRATRRVVVRLRTRPCRRRRCVTRCVNSSCARAHCFCNMKLVRMCTRGCGDAPKAEQVRSEPG
jgi:hypothetical protein